MEALFGLGAIVVIIIGTSTGICSATEAAAVAAVYALFVTVCVYHNISAACSNACPRWRWP